MNKNDLLKICLICYITGFIIGIVLCFIFNSIKSYSMRDVNRILDIYLDRTKATYLDYRRLDVNDDNIIDLLDGVIILNYIGE